MKKYRNFIQEKNIILSVSFVLSLLCLAYFIKGFYYLIIAPSGAVDLYGRWQEQQYIYRALYPYNIRPGSPLVIPEIGPVTSSGYPPWSFLTGFIIFPPLSWELTRWYYGLLNLISLIILTVFAYQIGIPYGKLKAWFTVLACLAISSHATTLGVGQYGIIINAFLIVVYWLLSSRKDVIAGLVFGLALAKPNISAIYFFILLIRQRTYAVIACFSYILVASLIIGRLVNLSPIYMLFHQIEFSQYFASKGYSAITLITKLGINTGFAAILSAILSVIITITVFYFLKDASLLYMFAIACVIGRLATYHLIYDNVMLVFLLLVMIQVTWGKTNSANILVLSLLLIVLVMPAKITDLPYVTVIQSIIYVGTVIYLLMFNRNNKTIISS